MIKVYEASNGDYKKPDPDYQTKNVNYIVLQLAEQGELLDKIMQTGKFSEKMTRYYMKSFLTGLYACHQ